MKKILLLSFVLFSCEYGLYISNENPAKPLILLFKTLSGDYQTGAEEVFKMRSKAYDEYYNQQGLKELKTLIPSKNISDYRFKKTKLNVSKTSSEKKEFYQVDIFYKERPSLKYVQASVECKWWKKHLASDSLDAVRCQITDLDFQ